MIHTLEAVVDEAEKVRLLENLTLPQARRALVMILEEPPLHANELALLSEDAFAADWNRPEEDKAWQHLQPVK